MLDSRQAFSENISLLGICGNILEYDQSLLQLVSDKMTIHLHVFSPLRKTGSLQCALLLAYHRKHV